MTNKNAWADRFSMKNVIICLLLWMCRLAFGQQLFNVTEVVPAAGIDGEDPLVLAVENATNVSVYCAVVFADGGSNAITQWSQVGQDDSQTYFDFIDGIGEPGFENYMTTPNAAFRRNLTILSFDGSLDNTQIACGAGGEIGGRFDLRIISKIIIAIVGG